ncbi:MAG: hypothetical protein CNIPEHKO_03563 [Anaerolineales bacterium]|nr:DUF3267 domain-containing protein [Anaerolineae bacterium]MBL8106157.1 DUF3267 domain-containing protein [Anaerolineales bacterium]MBV6403226.1 hypothetical protein [Anaerolineales bacterium]MCC7187528.1 DUF3267 domain-containing protein [Anaerolineales bacterium]
MPNLETTSGEPPLGYAEALYWKIAEKTSRILIINLLSIPLAFVFGIVFFTIARVFGKSTGFFFGSAATTLLFALLLTIIIHELIHGMTMQIFGARPKYGINWKGLMLYATAPGYAFQRNQYLVIVLAPLAAISLAACLGILIQAGSPSVWLWAICATINGGAAIGDLWITAIALRYPKHAYIVDEQDGMRIFLPRGENKT